MILTHPPSNAKSEEIFSFPIGRVMNFITDSMISVGIEFRKVDSTYGWSNEIIHMGGKYYDGDVYKLCFHPIKTLSVSQARYITSLFCCHDEYDNIDINNDVIAPKEWVNYLTFQTSITEESKPYDDGVLSGRIIVQIRLYGAYMLILDEKINSILC
jgi:hypothetical protein